MKLIITFCLVFITTLSTLAADLANTLAKHQQQFDLVLPAKYQRGKVHVLDISKQSKTFKDVDIYSTAALVAHSKALRQQLKVDMLVGKYMEDRNIYKRGVHYDTGKEPRSVHLGQDLMVPAGTPVYAPLAGVVHSFRDNRAKADYGPTIILKHKLDHTTFYTLYGHLSRTTLPKLRIGQTIKSHQKIATVGKPDENGGWPEHLHFQIIDDMQGAKDNYIGVIEPSRAKAYRRHCPDPNLILNIPALNNMHS